MREETKLAEEYDKIDALTSVSIRVSSPPLGARPAARSGEDTESQSLRTTGGAERRGEAGGPMACEGRSCG